MTTFGPVRGPQGRVDVTVGPSSITLRPRGSALDAVDGGEILLVLGAVVIVVVGALLPEPFSYVCFAVAGLVVLGLALTYVVAYATAAVMLVATAVRLLTEDGRRRVRRSLKDLMSVTAVEHGELSRAEILWVSPVERRLRPRLRLGHPRGELVLSAWAWRAGELEGLARELEVSAAP
ncbi:hypothetical protein [Nocardioides lijunqiniae]|uniref:hypothetical protein n=1 Tax=Nocardioides lijunqiniae TaxID=2760832 RepID=UPI001877EF8E|nr:hypothetical protein [Nocardioides lijunqiniae]